MTLQQNTRFRTSSEVLEETLYIVAHAYPDYEQQVKNMDIAKKEVDKVFKELMKDEQDNK